MKERIGRRCVRRSPASAPQDRDRQPPPRGAVWASRQPRRVGEELSATRMRVQLPIMTFLNPRRISLLSVPDKSEILPRIRNWHTGRRPVRLDRYFGVIPQVSLGSRAEECAGRRGSDEACLWQWVVGWRV